MILNPPDDSDGNMCLGNPPSYSAFVLGLGFTLRFPEVRWGWMGLRGNGGRTEDRWRTRGYEERCVRIHVLVRRAMAGKQRHGGMYTHLDTCASAFSRTLKATSCPEGRYHRHERRSCSPMWQSMWKCCQLASDSERISPSAEVSVDSTV